MGWGISECCKIEVLTSGWVCLDWLWGGRELGFLNLAVVSWIGGFI